MMDPTPQVGDVIYLGQDLWTVETPCGPYFLEIVRKTASSVSICWLFPREFRGLQFNRNGQEGVYE